MNVYDRLAAFGRKRLGDNRVFDHNEIRGELAERIDRNADGRTFTFHIPQGATSARWWAKAARASRSRPMR